MAVAFRAASSEYSGTSGTCPKPTGTLSTDLLVFGVVKVETSVSGSISLSGWTELWNEVHNFPGTTTYVTWGCFVAAGSVSDPTPTVTGAGDHTMVCAAYSGVDLSNPVVGISDLASGNAFGSFLYSSNLPDPLTGGHFVGVVGLSDNTGSATWQLLHPDTTTTSLTHRVSRQEVTGFNSSSHIGSGDSPSGEYAGGWRVGAVRFGESAATPRNTQIGVSTSEVERLVLRGMLLRPS